MLAWSHLCAVPHRWSTANAADCASLHGHIACVNVADPNIVRSRTTSLRPDQTFLFPLDGTRMRTLHVIGSVNPALGGPMEGIRQFARAHLQPDSDVEVCSLDTPDDAFVHSSELTIHALGRDRSRAGASALLRWLRANAHRFDAVLVHGVGQRHARAVWRASRELGFPYYVVAHGMLGPLFAGRLSIESMSQRLVWPLIGYRVLRDAEAVLFRCEAERALARKAHWLYQARDQVIGYGILPPRLRPGQIDSFLAEYPALQGKRFLLYVGRIQPSKGCDLLIESFASVAQRDPGLQLVLAGPDAARWQGKLAARAAALGVADRVHWVGVLNGDLKWGALSACDAFVLPSHEDSLGVSAVEAMACRKAVLISTEVEIWREIDAAGGGLVAADTSEGTTSMLERWLELSSAQRRFVGERARACYERHFTVEGAATRLRKLVDSRAGLANP
jgi:glycosyltransferase involved in cell wall biosynthesis